MIDAKDLRMNDRLSLATYTYAYKSSKYSMTNDVKVNAYSYTEPEWK